MLCFSRISPNHIASACLLTVSLSGCGQQAEKPVAPASITLREIEVSAESVSKQPLANELEFTGNLLPKRASRLTFEVDGIVANIPQVGAQFDVTLGEKRYQQQLSLIYGQRVAEGDTLVELDTTDYELQVQIAEAKLAKAQADLAKLSAGARVEELQRLTALKSESQARFDQALREQQRMQQLGRSNVISSSETDQAVTGAATAKALLQSAQAMLASAQAGPTREELAVQQAEVRQFEVELTQAKQNLEKTKLVAPYSGVIVSINVEVGDRVAASSNPVIEMMEIEYLVAEIGVPESLVGRVRVGDLAQVHAAGATVAVPGLAVAVNEMVDPQTRTFKVRVAVDNQSRQFKAGQFAKVVLSIGTAGNEATVIPNASIVFTDGQPTVFVVEDGRVRRQQVSLGLAGDRLTEVLSGVVAGSIVVTDDPTLLADGMQVKLREQQISLQAVGHKTSGSATNAY